MRRKLISIFPWPQIDEGALAQRVRTADHDGSAEKAALALDEKCKNVYQELENNWQRVLNILANRQISLFQTEFRRYTKAVLIGEEGPNTNKEGADKAKNRMGSLIWLNSYVSKQVEHLTNAQGIFKKALVDADLEISDLEKEWIAGGNQKGSLLSQMKENEGKQSEYLKKRQNWLNLKRWKVNCEAEMKVIEALLVETVYFRDRLGRYAQVLNGATRSMSAHLNQRLEEIKNEENSATDLRQVREIVNDETWENLQYKHFLQPDSNLRPADYNVLNSIHWDVQEFPYGERGEKIVPEPRLSIGGFRLEQTGPLESNVIEIRVPKEDLTASEIEIKNNAYRLLESCRVQFTPVWNDLTVVDYFKYKYDSHDADSNPEAFAEYLLSKCNVLLSPGAQNQNAPTWMAYLIAPGNDANDPWLQRAIQKLRVNTTAAAAFSNVLLHNDTTTLTYLVLLDGVEIKTLDAYIQGAYPYLNTPEKGQGEQLDRRLMHIFVAEKNATHFDRLNRDNTRYLVSTRVTMVLEEEELLSDFIIAMGLGIISQQEQGLGGRVGKVIKATLTVKEMWQGSLREREKVFFLNDPENYPTQDVDYLVAAETFCLRSFDLSPESAEISTLHKLLKPIMDEKIATKIETELLPHWKTGEGTSQAVAAAHEPDERLRKDKLILEARKSLYRSIYPLIEGRLTALRSIPSDQAQLNKTLSDEIEFIKILLVKINEFTSN